MMVDSLALYSGIRRDVGLGKYTTFGVGGKCSYFVEARSTDELARLYKLFLNSDIQTTVIGAGTNLLVSDRGVQGAVIRSAGREIEVKGSTVRVSSGVKMMRLARIVAAAGLSGLEFAVGIPGTVGGSVYQNAGCFGSDTASVLERIGVMDTHGKIYELKADECEFGYRYSSFRYGALHKFIILYAVFTLCQSERSRVEKMMREISLKRRLSQPLAGRSAGSTFKNPPGLSAGAIVEECGLKGYRIGGAVVSSEHANFIMNVDNATADDINSLIMYIQRIVFQKRGIMLEPEVEKVGIW